MRNIAVGILAHVDAGKTTCIESMLYNAGTIRKMGRVDHKDAFRDYDNQERDRGITIFSKEAHFHWKDSEIYVIDTPGHVDFSSEMERSLQVLDLAIILINAQDGVQSHTETIWKCLEHYNVPALLFINKMDITYTEKEELMDNLQSLCSDNCIDFTDIDLEKVALTSDDLLSEYTETGTISSDSIARAVYKRECFPTFFGSALKNQGIEQLMDAICDYTLEKEYPEDFGAKVYKISTDDQGNRLTHLKITGGTLKAKQKISETEKVDQIRLYSGPNYTMIQEADAGMICAVKGFTELEAGQGIGIEADSPQPVLSAFLNYQLLLPRGVDPLQMMDVLTRLSKEDPQLQINYDEQTRKIHLRLMGTIQMEVIQKMIKERSGIHVEFTTGNVIYRETILNPVYGYGHFEPLRHYAEVHLYLEPLPPGSGMKFETDISTDKLALNWQRLIRTHLEEKEHRGVLTGSPITDIKISLVAGKAHLKHTMGGDFRQATYRAVRQGLKKADSILLEPYYQFAITVPSSVLSKVLFDLENKHARIEIKDNPDGTMTVTGIGPVRLMMNYQKEIVALTHGKGKYSCVPDGYYPCEDAQDIILERGYDSETDFRNPTGSVFCAQGSGYVVPWNEVEEHLHIPIQKDESSQGYRQVRYTVKEEELKRVVNMAGGQNKNTGPKIKLRTKQKPRTEIKIDKVELAPKLPDCLIVDGYNMIYAWDDLKDLIKTDVESARYQLIDMLSNYQGYRNCRLIVVFDGYRVKNNPGETMQRGDTHIVYTRQGQTADSYIEKSIHELKGTYHVIVATSDALIQNSALAQGASRMSARELENRVKKVNSTALEYIRKSGL